MRDCGCGGGEEEGEDAGENEQSSRHSIKRSFLAKVQSPLLGYGSNFELMQLAWAQNLSSALGSKRNLPPDRDESG